MDEYLPASRQWASWGFTDGQRLPAPQQQSALSLPLSQDCGPMVAHAVDTPNIVNAAVSDYLAGQVPTPSTAHPHLNLYDLAISSPYETYPYDCGLEYGDRSYYPVQQAYAEGGGGNSWSAEQNLSPHTVSDFDISRIQMDHQRRVAPILHPFAPMSAASERWPHLLQPHPDWQPKLYHSSPSTMSSGSSNGRLSTPSLSASSEMASFVPGFCPPNASTPRESPPNNTSGGCEDCSTVSREANRLLSIAAGSDRQCGPMLSSTKDVKDPSDEGSETQNTGKYSPGKYSSGSLHGSPRATGDATDLAAEQSPKSNPSEDKDEYTTDWRTCDENAPYAIHIYRALMSVPEHKLDLGAIYDFFVDTMPRFRKMKGKGWKNSVRHNLSMNGAFLKQQRLPGDDGKGCIWALSDHAILNGIKSTTRYRKSATISQKRSSYSSASRRDRTRRRKASGASIKLEKSTQKDDHYPAPIIQEVVLRPTLQPIIESPMSSNNTVAMEQCSSVNSTPESIVEPEEQPQSLVARSSPNLFTGADYLGTEGQVLGHISLHQPVLSPLESQYVYTTYPQYATNHALYTDEVYEDCWMFDSGPVQVKHEYPQYT